MAKEIIISNGKEVDFRKISQTLNKNDAIRKNSKNIEQIRFYLDHDDTRGVSLLSFSYNFFQKETTRGVYVIPKIDSDSYLGICDENGNIIATLKYNKENNSVTLRAPLDKDLTESAEASNFLNQIINLLTTQEYSCVALTQNNAKLSYEPTAWKDKVNAITLCANDNGKYCAYNENYNQSMQQIRDDWRKIKLQSELENVVEFVKDEESSTVLKFKYSPDSGISFNVNFPLLKKGESLAIGSRGYSRDIPILSYVISREDDNKIKVNYLSDTEKYSEFWKAISSAGSSLISRGIKYVTAKKDSEGYVILDAKQRVEAKIDLNRYRRLKEVESGITFEDDIASGVTILKWYDSNEKAYFYHRLPLVEDGCHVAFIDHEYIGIEVLLSKSDNGKIRVHPLIENYNLNESQSEHLYSSLLHTMETRGTFRIKLMQLDAEEVVVAPNNKKWLDKFEKFPRNKEGYHAASKKRPTKNPELEKFVSNFIQDMKKDYFSRDVSGVADLVYKIVSNNPKDKLPSNNSKMIDLLEKAGAIKITEHKTGSRGWGQFFLDLLDTIKSCFMGNSLGKLIGKGTITISKDVDMGKLNELMTAKEEPTKGQQR